MLRAKVCRRAPRLRLRKLGRLLALLLCLICLSSLKRGCRSDGGVVARETRPTIHSHGRRSLRLRSRPVQPGLPRRHGDLRFTLGPNRNQHPAIPLVHLRAAVKNQKPRRTPGVHRGDAPREFDGSPRSEPASLRKAMTAPSPGYRYPRSHIESSPRLWAGFRLRDGLHLLVSATCAVASGHWTIRRSPTIPTA